MAQTPNQYAKKYFKKTEEKASKTKTKTNQKHKANYKKVQKNQRMWNGTRRVFSNIPRPPHMRLELHQGVSRHQGFLGDG